jgi:hypothetical protein
MRSDSISLTPDNRTAEVIGDTLGVFASASKTGHPFCESDVLLCREVIPFADIQRLGTFNECSSEDLFLLAILLSRALISMSKHHQLKLPRSLDPDATHIAQCSVWAADDLAIQPLKDLITFYILFNSLESKLLCQSKNLRLSGLVDPSGSHFNHPRTRVKML